MAEPRERLTFRERVVRTENNYMFRGRELVKFYIQCVIVNFFKRSCLTVSSKANRRRMLWRKTRDGDFEDGILGYKGGRRVKLTARSKNAQIFSIMPFRSILLRC
jgi:hypothetical protein